VKTIISKVTGEWARGEVGTRKQ